jgi:hypothetical protein
MAGSPARRRRSRSLPEEKTIVARGKTRTQLKAKPKAQPRRWQLYYVTDADQFECDFVVAKSAAGAQRLFKREYGDLPGIAELVVEIEKPPDWLTKGCWLGPDPDLAELGGTKLPTIDFPRWRFANRVWGPRKTMAARYRKLKE